MDVQKKSPQTASPTVEYTDFWQAIKNTDFNYLHTINLLPEHERFTQAIKSITINEVEQAEVIVKELLISTSDSLVRKHSKAIYQNLLFYQSKWKTLWRYSERTDQLSKNQDIKTLVEEYMEAAEEVYSFPRDKQIIPFQPSSTGTPVVAVHINGVRKKFWLDTGSSLSVIASDVAAECSVSPMIEVKTQANTATGQKIDIKPAIIREMKLGNLKISNHPVIIVDKQDLQLKLLGLFKIFEIEGILGWNAIKNMYLEIDYQDNSLAIDQPSGKDKPVINLFWLGHPILKIMHKDGSELNFCLDSGARKSSLTNNALFKLDYNNLHREDITIGSAGGFQKVQSYQVSDFTIILNDHSITFDEINTHPVNHSQFIKLDGILGNDIIKNTKITIDAFNGMFEYELLNNH